MQFKKNEANPRRPKEGRRPLSSCARNHADTTACRGGPFGRAKAFRERQYSLAEAILDAAERYLENMEPDDMDAMSFADACKALEVASRLGQQAANRIADDPAQSARSLQDQLAALLDQAYGEVASKNDSSRPDSTRIGMTPLGTTRGPPTAPTSQKHRARQNQRPNLAKNGQIRPNSAKSHLPLSPAVPPFRPEFPWCLSLLRTMAF